MNRKRITHVSVSILVVSIFVLNIPIFNLNIPNLIENPFDDDREEDFPDNLESSDYSSSTEGSGGDIDVTLYQSLLDTSTTQFSNIDVSNTFTKLI